MTQPYEEEFRFLANLNQCRSKEEMQSILTSTLGEIQQRINISRTLKNEWIHAKSSHKGQRHGILPLSRFLRTAEVIREHLIALTMKFMCLDAMYALLVDTCKLSAFDRFDWLEKEIEQERSSDHVRKRVSLEIRLLDSIIADIDKELGKEEKAINDFNARMKYMDEQFQLLSGQLDHVEPDDEPMYDEALVVEAENAEEREVTIYDDGSSASVQVLPAEPPADNEYMDRLIDENKDQYEEDNKSDERSGTPQKREAERQIAPEPNNEERKLRQQVTRLEEEILQLRVELRYLPQRKISETSEGIDKRIICAFCNAAGQHFSDSCPNMTSSEDRFNFIRNECLCQYCLTNCRPGRCRYRGKRCWYCERVEASILHFLILDDGGHHRALCNIPDSRARIWDRIDDVKAQLQSARNRLNDL